MYSIFWCCQIYKRVQDYHSSPGLMFIHTHQPEAGSQEVEGPRSDLLFAGTGLFFRLNETASS